MNWYAYGEQDRHYRTAARDRGCTCPDLPAHVHEVTCILYVVPGGVPGGLHDHEEDHAEERHHEEGFKTRRMWRPW